MNDRIFILGAGRAGRAIGRALRAGGLGSVALHGRRASADSDVTAGPLPAVIADATIVLVAVRDAQMDDGLAEIGRVPLAPDAVVLHMSGCMDPVGLRPLRARGHACGTFHPLVPMTEDPDGAVPFAGIYFGVDGDPTAIAAATRLAQHLGGLTLAIPAGSKPAYHAAAVIASNFPVVLAAIAEGILLRAGVDPDNARGAVRSLLDGAATNLHTRSACDALTGPAVRGDAGTVAAHVAALQGSPDVVAIYESLTRAATELVRSRGATGHP